MGYLWDSWWQSATYSWTGWTWQLFGYKPRWRNPTCDVPPGMITKNTQLAEGVSTKIEWPEEYRDLSIGTGPVGQTNVWQGTLSGAGKPVQLVDPDNTVVMKMDNKNGGTWLKQTGEVVELPPTNVFYTGLPVNIPRPLHDGWGIEGYPNGANTGDRHWYGVDPNTGTVWEAIQFFPELGTVGTLMVYDNQGNVIEGFVDGKSAIKGGQQWTSLAWNYGDQPHRLGMVFKWLGRHPTEGWTDSPEPWATKFKNPAYGRLYRLSEEEYQRQLALNPDSEQKNFLDSLRFYGVEPYDQGGNGWHGTIGFVAGAQQKQSTVPNLDIPISELELIY